MLGRLRTTGLELPATKTFKPSAHSFLFRKSATVDYRLKKSVRKDSKLNNSPAEENKWEFLKQVKTNYILALTLDMTLLERKSEQVC